MTEPFEMVPMLLENDSGKMVPREACFTVDVRMFARTAIYPYLLMCANPHLSSPDITRVIFATGAPATYRSARWLNARRWMVSHAKRPVAAEGSPGRRPNADGRDPQAIRIMRDNPEMSLRNLVRLLKDHGIVRNKNWVRQYRCA